MVIIMFYKFGEPSELGILFVSIYLTCFSTIILGFYFYGQIYFQDVSSQPELKLPSASSSPIIDPHPSPCGTMLAYVKDSELHVLDLLSNESKQLTSGADGNTIVSFIFSTFVGGSHPLSRMILGRIMCCAIRLCAFTYILIVRPSPPSNSLSGFLSDEIIFINITASITW